MRINPSDVNRQEKQIKKRVRDPPEGLLIQLTIVIFSSLGMLFGS